MAAAADSLLVRKMRQGGIARSPLPNTEIIGETFARTVEERLRPLVKTIVGAMVMECRVVKLSEALQSVSIPAMLGVIAVEDAATDGLLNCDTDLAYHLVDLMLGGDPAAAPIPTTRTFTSIDMAVCRLALDAFVAAFAETLATTLGRPLTKQITLKDQKQNISQMQFAPDYVDVLVLSIALDIGEAARTGNFDLLLPLATLDVIRAAFAETADEAALGRPDDLWKAQMRRAAARSTVAVDAVLHRPRMTVAAVEKLRVGDVIEIPDGAPNAIQLRIAQPGHQTLQLTEGRLGTFQGCKVVKLDGPVDERVRSYLKRNL